jgi:hypothetical protein
MATLNLENDNVELVSVTVDQARDNDFDIAGHIAEALDNAQARVFGGDYANAFLVIEIVKGA